MTTPNVSLAHLYALRAHLEAVILSAEAEAGIAQGQQVEPGSCPQCGTPPDQVSDASTLDGTKRRRCNVCGAEWELP